ncbi:MAG: penicillin-binding transpeptidase domain-containing protein, partial [Gammaproteobacteria bacterium]
YGKRVRPQIVYAVEDTRQDTLTPQAAHYLQPVPIVAQSNWDAVIDAMVQVVHGRRGTARHIGLNAPYRIAGQTGTAQVFGLKEAQEYKPDEIAKRLRDHALFIAFAPADNPRIAIAVIVENGGSGSAVAAPIARQIMDAYLVRQKL